MYLIHSSFLSVNKELECSPLDDSLTNIQWLGRMSTDGLGPDDAAKKVSDKENQESCQQLPQVKNYVAIITCGFQVHQCLFDLIKKSMALCPFIPKLPRETEGNVNDPQSERPPYSYMAMIQFAINSKKNRRMTLKEIYTWIEDHFPYFRNVAKPGWKVIMVALMCT